MKAYPHLFTKLFCRPLMLDAAWRYALESDLLARMGLSHATAERGAPLRSARVAQIYQSFANVALVHVAGVIDKHISDADLACYGGCDLADVDSALALAESDPRIDTVVLAINSPGGSVIGVPETAARVQRLTQTKDVHAYVDALCCSAAYWIASQADQITATRSAVLGSIGVYCAVLDATRKAEMEGYKVELITAGKFKAMTSPFKPLSTEERAMLQASVDKLHGEFRAAVRSGRRRKTENGGHVSVSDETMEGQWFDGDEARARKLVDNLTGESLDEYVAALL